MAAICLLVVDDMLPVELTHFLHVVVISWFHGRNRPRSAGLSIEGTVVQSHLPPFRNLVSFTPHSSASFGRDTNSRWSLLSGVYITGSEISHTGVKCVTCSGLTNSR